MIRTLYWENNKLFVLNQLLLPQQEKFKCCKNHKEVAYAIKEMIVRGAPAIGVAASFGMVLAALEKKFSSFKEMKDYVYNAGDNLMSSRPTAVNLFWAIDRMKKVLNNSCLNIDLLKRSLLKEAKNIYEEDILINRKIGDFGAKLLKKNSTVITHCNAGALATAGYGTALGVIRSAYKSGKIKLVYVDETRPYLQGARLTAWELQREKIPFRLITDNMAGHLMKVSKVDAVIVGADRIAANGDTANKIGTYSLAILAHYHKIPFYVAAPTSTIDCNTQCGSKINIEERSAREVIYICNKLIAPQNTQVRHPAFDVTPAKFIKNIITEKGIFVPNKIKKAVSC